MASPLYKLSRLHTEESALTLFFPDSMTYFYTFFFVILLESDRSFPSLPIPLTSLNEGVSVYK